MLHQVTVEHFEDGLVSCCEHLIVSHLHELAGHKLHHIVEKLGASILLKLNFVSLKPPADITAPPRAMIRRYEVGPLILEAVHAELGQSELPEGSALANCAQVGLLYPGGLRSSTDGRNIG